jgi:hypothetical protein
VHAPHTRYINTRSVVPGWRDERRRAGHPSPPRSRAQRSGQVRPASTLARWLEPGIGSGDGPLDPLDDQGRRYVALASRTTCQDRHPRRPDRRPARTLVHRADRPDGPHRGRSVGLRDGDGVPNDGMRVPSTAVRAPRGVVWGRASTSSPLHLVHAPVDRRHQPARRRSAFTSRQPRARDHNAPREEASDPSRVGRAT